MKDIVFLTNQTPLPKITEDVGDIVAIGGSLTSERLLEAYQKGIFPWYSSDEPVAWWSPDPRFILLPNEIYISKSMNKLMKSKKFSITYNTNFEEVIFNCKMLREKDGTWITDEMLHSYINLHKLGFAHSVEVWNGKKLAGGLYGVSIGMSFFGESMFSIESNASKIALIDLAINLSKLNFDMIDCQVYTDHLASMGAFEIDRKYFIKILNQSVNTPFNLKDIDIFKSQ